MLCVRPLRRNSHIPRAVPSRVLSRSRSVSDAASAAGCWPNSWSLAAESRHRAGASFAERIAPLFHGRLPRACPAQSWKSCGRRCWISSSRRSSHLRRRILRRRRLMMMMMMNPHRTRICGSVMARTSFSPRCQAFIARRREDRSSRYTRSEHKSDPGRGGGTSHRTSQAQDAALLLRARRLRRCEAMTS